MENMNGIHDRISLSDPKFLTNVDKLRDLNIGQHVPLGRMMSARLSQELTISQLVAVGDQSSGKSSLLESLTGVPFPQDQSLCTRHATQITSRRDKNEFVLIRIIAGPQATEEHRRYLDGFPRRINSIEEFHGQLVDILKQAAERMGLRSETSGAVGAVFSEDVLKIEIHGPHEDFLTIIDVPGIFRTATQGTTKEDMVLVRDMVKKYIRDKRTIILAVLPSNVDVATQEILELASEYDKEGVRTLGILTKPDLVLESSAQNAVCELIRGKKKELSLGYYLVRNRGPSAGPANPFELDQTLQRMPWSELPRERIGIKALKEQLEVLLREITQREFPELLQEIRNLIRESRRELDSLGPPRQDEREQRTFLSRIAEAFQDRTRAALNADYIADQAFKQPELCLITQVVNITDAFGADFQQYAHSRYFETIDELQDAPTPLHDPCGDDTDDSANGYAMKEVRELLRTARIDEPTETERIELSDILVNKTAHTKPSGNVAFWIKDAYLKSRGLDLGTFNPNMISMVFAEQSKKWGKMANEYMSRIIVVLHRFIAAALHSVCREEQTRKHLWSAILEELVERYKQAIDQAGLLVDIEQNKQPYTLNRRFSEARSKIRAYRTKELLYGRARKDVTQYGETQFMVNLNDIATMTEGKSNVEQLQDDIHDIVHAYYSIALDRLVDNLFQIAVDHCLLRGPSSPLKVLNQDWVINLESEELERIVGESKLAKKQRGKLKKKIEDLKEALEILKS